MTTGRPQKNTLDEWLDEDDLQRKRIAVFVWCEDCELYAELIRARLVLRCPLCGEALRRKAEPELYEDAN